MMDRYREYVVLTAVCVAIFWPGASLFGFPGVMGSHWQQVFGVGKADVGQTLFFMLAAVGIFMFLVGRWKEKIGSTAMAYLGAIVCGFNTIWLGRISSFTLVYVWAFPAGVVSCLIYLPGITVVQQWFPERRELVSGLFNMSFASSGAVLAPVFTLMLAPFGYCVWLCGRPSGSMAERIFVGHGSGEFPFGVRLSGGLSGHFGSVDLGREADKSGHPRSPTDDI